MVSPEAVSMEPRNRPLGFVSVDNNILAFGNFFLIRRDACSINEVTAS